MTPERPPERPSQPEPLRRSRRRSLRSLLAEVLINQHHHTKQLERIMALLDALTAAVANETTVEQSAITLLNGLSQQLKDALAAGADPAAVQAVVDQIDASSAALAAAVTANTPAPPAPPAPAPT